MAKTTKEKTPSLLAVRAAHRVLFTAGYAPTPAAELAAAKMFDEALAPIVKAVRDVRLAIDKIDATLAEWETK